jgi:hypothetical protein
MVNFLGVPLGGRIVLHALKWWIVRPLVLNGAVQRSIRLSYYE